MKFEKGKSGNPGGRSKIEKQIREWFRTQRVPVLDADGEAVLDSDGNPAMVDGHEAILRRLFDIALKGEDKHALVAIKEYFDRAFGKAKQKIDVGGDLNTGPRIDMRNLTDDDLRVLAKLDLGAEADGPIH